ncbi:chromosome segregation protein SMC [bacterium]|nr:MAG: chromosome segregation protein SMC [bacterium]
MRLKSVKLFGFKTFAESTTLEFEPGITAVVGPNGSGKSNFVEAIRWVLGETSTRSLRSAKLEDVIFAGNERRKPLGLAEVVLTFDNESGRLPVDFREVAITRRAYRAGESEYYINRNQVRLRDVLDLLMGTGLGPGSYAIVSQGQIDAILSSKPQERRELFEETSGVNRFLVKKKEATRRLEQTEQNAIRVNDLLSELEKQVPELETQVRRAKRHRRLSERLRDLEILSYLRSSASRREERERLRAQLDEGEAQRAAAQAQAAARSAELSTARYRSYQQELALEEQRAAAQAARAEQARLEAELSAASARLEALEAQSARADEGGQRAEEEREALQVRLREVDDERGPLTGQVERARTDEAQAQERETAQRRRLEALFGALRDLEASVAEQAAREAERRAQAESARKELERLLAEAAEARRSAEALESELARKEEHVRAQRERIGELEARVERAVAEESAAGERVAQARERYAQVQSALKSLAAEEAAATSRLHTIEELEASYEGHVPGTRAVVQAAERGDVDGLIGVVSNLIQVDEQYARALDVAFGARLSNIVARGSADAEQAVAWLKRHEAGRATFLPLDLLGRRAGRTLPSQLRGRHGVIAYAHELVTCDSAYAGIVAFLVGNVLVVDELRTGIALVRSGEVHDSVVTLDGDQIMGGGAITGGRFKRERAILERRAQAQALRGRLQTLKAELERNESIERDLAGEGQTAAAEFERARRRHQGEEVALGQARTALTAVVAEAERARREIATHLEKGAALVSASREAEGRTAALEAAVYSSDDTAAERARLERDLEAVRAAVAAAESERAERGAAATALRERLAALSAARDAAAARLAALDTDAERARTARDAARGELEALRGRRGELEQSTQSARAHADGAESDAVRARGEREGLTARVTELEAAVREAEHRERELSQSLESARIRFAEIEAELNVLAQTFAQHPATEQEQGDVLSRYADYDGDPAADVPKLREDLARLANVNLNAESDLEALAERERFLKEQMDDLHAAREKLLAVIAEIESSAQETFNKTFEAVQASFTETFARLFPGGVARMWQTDPEHLSETGIEIAVAPPGKKMMSLQALSGGERAMVSVALIFAILKVKPSPFYLFDEIDAALDEANVSRFSDLVKEFAQESQLLIVTHNKRTMELADRIYGVTMREPGISTIVSARLEAADVA